MHRHNYIKLIMNLKELATYSKSGIWGFINVTDKRIFISGSENILSAVSRNIEELLLKNHSCRLLLQDIPNLELIILETSVPKNQRKAKQSFCMDHYLSQGYSLYRTRKPVSYRITTAISNDYFVHVLLVNSRNDKIVVGVFDKMDDATQFITSHYNTSKIYNITYSKNNLTKLFYNNRKNIDKILDGVGV